MDYPYQRKTRFNVSNNWWFLPSDLFKTEQDKEIANKTLRRSPVLTYLDEISRKYLFNYILIVFLIILLFYRLNLPWTVWVGLPIGVLFVYYLNERNAQELNSTGDQIWSILKSPLLKNTKYFVTDPPFIQWVADVSEFKKFNVLEFNKMITNLDRLLKLIYDLKLGVHRCKENLDLIKDLKIQSLNQFHSLVYNINNADLLGKYNYYFEQLGFLLNERHAELIKICKLYYIMKPVDIDSRLTITSIDEPTARDEYHNNNYNFYN